MLKMALVSLAFAPTAFATSPGTESLVEKHPDTATLNEVVKFRAIPGHHFNDQAPQKCGEVGNPNLNEGKTEAKCQFTKEGAYTVQLSICDDANTFCKLERRQLSVSHSGQERFPYSPSEAGTQGTLLPPPKGFEPLSRNEVMAKLKSKRQPVLVLVSTNWCPPCNELKDFLLGEEIFRQSTKDALLVYVDGDQPDRKGWEIPILGYPTMVILNENLEEVSRRTGYISAPQFETWWTADGAQNRISLKQVESQEKERRDHKWWRRLMDWLWASPEDIHQDRLRLARAYQAQEKYSELLDLLKNNTDPESRGLYINTRLTMFSKEKPENAEEVKEYDQRRGDFLKLVLAKDVDADGYPYFLMQYCGIDPEDCKRFLQPGLASIERMKEEPTKNPRERALLLANSEGLKAYVHDAMSNSVESKKAFAQCAEHFRELAGESGQGLERAALQNMATCLRGAEKWDEALVVYKALTERYPTENTFWFAQAQVFKKKKQYKEALARADEALKVGYGHNWLKTVMLKAELQEALGKKALAKDTLRNALAKIHLPDDPNEPLHRLAAAVKSRMEKL